MRRDVQAQTTIPVPVNRVADLVFACPRILFEWSGRLDTPNGRPEAALAVGLGNGVELTQVVEVMLGRPERRGDGVAVSLGWHSTLHAAIFPAFEGIFTVAPSDDAADTVVRIDGCYTVPPGGLGRFGDGLAGRRLARRSLEAFLADAAARLAAEVARRRAVAPCPAEHRVSVWEAGKPRMTTAACTLGPLAPKVPALSDPSPLPDDRPRRGR